MSDPLAQLGFLALKAEQYARFPSMRKMSDDWHQIALIAAGAYNTIADLRAEVARLEGEKAAMAAALRDLLYIHHNSAHGHLDRHKKPDETGFRNCRVASCELARAALSPDAGIKKCEKCRGTGARHVAGEPTQEPCGECSGEGVISDAGTGWVPPEVSLLLESLAGRWAFERFGYPDDTYPAAALELLDTLDALKVK